MLDHALPQDALGPLVRGVRKGLSICQEVSQPRPQRMPLMDPVAIAILAMAKRLLITVHWEVGDLELLLLRATATSVASYLFFNRGECSACALAEDLVIDDTHITLLLRYEKGQKTLNEVPTMAPPAETIDLACSLPSATQWA